MANPLTIRYAAPMISINRRSFLQALGIGSAALAATPTAHTQEKIIQGFEKTPVDPNVSKDWKPVSDRKVRMGIVGYIGMACERRRWHGVHPDAINPHPSTSSG